MLTSEGKKDKDLNPCLLPFIRFSETDLQWYPRQSELFL